MAELWLSKQDVADLLGKQHEFVRTQIIPRLPESGKRRGRGRGAPWELLGSAVVSAFVEYVAETSTGDPESYSSSGSPAMERQRLARAMMLEWELAEKQKQLISVELFQRVTEAAFLPIRKFAEEQIKEHGSVVDEAWQEAVEEFKREIINAIGKPSDNDGEVVSDAPSATADSAVADAVG